MPRKAASTIRTYDAAQRYFSAWCDRQNFRGRAIEAEDVARYLRFLSGVRSAATVAHNLAAIAAMFRGSGLGLDTKHPAIQRVMVDVRKRVRG